MLETAPGCHLRGSAKRLMTLSGRGLPPGIRTFYTDK
jgi:hypothetical protein